MSRIVVALALVLVAGSSAQADGPIVARIGLGITAARDRSSDARLGPGLHLDVAFRAQERFAVGVHVGIARSTKTTREGNMEPEDDFLVDRLYLPLQAGAGAQWSIERFWLAPWVGVHRGWLDDVLFAFGLGAGADLYIHPTGHRVCAYLELSRGIDGFKNSDTYSAGVAYRYW